MKNRSKLFSLYFVLQPPSSGWEGPFFSHPLLSSPLLSHPWQPDAPRAVGLQQSPDRPRTCVDSSGPCVCPPACMANTRWVGGSAGREWERWERGRWNTEGSSPETHRVSESREGRREGGREGGTVIGRGGKAEKMRGQICRETGWRAALEGEGGRGKDGEVRHVSGTRGRGDEQRGLEGGRVTGRDGGVGVWGGGGGGGGDNDIRCRRVAGRVAGARTGGGDFWPSTITW